MKRLALALLASCATAPLEIQDYPCPPQGTTLTYASFGQRFIDTNCSTCHSASAGSRHGAPENFQFDTIEDVHHRADRIFVRAAATNTSMPPGPVDPPPDERDKLAEWLACGAP
ncbi:MAG: hypothetical protein JWO36_4168 [Myxococcales bacterium]|nr:hypothetical protein [Myxococcales bacterium]